MTDLPPELKVEAEPTADPKPDERPPVHEGPTHPRRPERSTSMGFVYFMLAFTVSTFGSMMLLMLLRPMLGDLGKGARFVLMFAPLGFGVFYGARVAMVGVRENLRLSSALKRGLGFGRR